METSLRLVFASDLHGSNLCLRKFLNMVLDLRATLALIGGDNAGKSLTPVVRVGPDLFKSTLAGREVTVKSGSALHQLQSDIDDLGSYAVRLDPHQAERLENDKLWREKVFLAAMRTRLRNWLWWAKDALEPKGISFGLINGNDDAWELDEVVNAAPFVVNPEATPLEVSGYAVVGESAASRTPFPGLPRDQDEADIEARIRGRLRARAIQAYSRSVFLFHCPPHGTDIDQAPLLRKSSKTGDLEIQRQAGHAVMAPAGSTAIAEIIKEFQPLLCLHGHIHESPGSFKLGRTLCLNPGSDYDSGVLRAAIIDLSGDVVVKHRFETR